MNHYEINARKSKVRGTLGYGLMWLFLALLTIIVPFASGNGHIIYYLLSAAMIGTGIYKMIVGIKNYLLND